MGSLTQISIDGKEILSEIECFYESKKNEYSQIIENSIESLEKRFEEDSLPESTVSELNNPGILQRTDNLRIPSPFSIGFLKPFVFPARKNIPALFDFISGKGLCIELIEDNEHEAHQFLQNTGLKILLSLHPSVSNVILIDPEGSGSNFRLLLGYEKAKSNLILNKSEINQKLSSVTSTFNRLQTDNLTFKYDTLEELNLSEPKLTKPYTFIFISNYPSGFRKEDHDLLESIIKRGSKFGTFVFMSFNPSHKAEWIKNDEIQTLINQIALLRKAEAGYKIFNCRESAIYNHHFEIELERESPSKSPELINFLNNLVKESDSKPVTQDDYYDKVLSGKIKLWQEYSNEHDKNTGIKAGVGLKSATEELEFTLDCNTDNYHAIIGGKTGSGKTVLLDNIIINASLKYPPDELQFVLLDFKGASFHKYRNLPHLKILFGGNNRNYGLNVLRFLNDENTRRQAILANYGGNINTLNKADRHIHNMPRLIIILDEFQILLKDIDSITREANRYIDTIAQQGRSAGMHLILSSQDLTGITISDSAQFNSNVRIALQMDPSACKQIFSMDNIEASFLEKKGEAIYNEKPGRPKFGNQRFKVYKLDDTVSKAIVAFLNNNLQADQYKTDRYFLPNEDSASVTDNTELLQQISHNGKKLLYPKIYIGEPSFIRINNKTYQKEDSYIQFKRAENSNLLMAGNDMNGASALLGLMLIQLLEQNTNAKTHLLNNFGSDKTEWRKRFKQVEDYYNDCFKYYQKNETSDVLSLIEDEIGHRKIDDDACSGNIYFFILNLDSSFQKQGYTLTEQSKKLVNILKQGPDLGVHTIIYSYSAKSVSTSGIENDLFETKIVLHGDSKDIIKIGEQKEPSKEGMMYLFAPVPVTSISPDLINIYCVFEGNKLSGIKEGIRILLKDFLTDFRNDDQE